MPRLRNIIRWIFLALALLYFAWTAPGMIHNLREWRAAVPSDPVAAEFWRSVFYMNLEENAIVLGIAIVIWLALKPRKRAASPGAQL